MNDDLIKQMGHLLNAKFTVEALLADYANVIATLQPHTLPADVVARVNAAAKEHAKAFVAKLPTPQEPAE